MNRAEVQREKLLHAIIFFTKNTRACHKLKLFKLLIGVPGEHQRDVPQLAFAVGQRAIAKIKNHQCRAECDRCYQKDAASDDPARELASFRFSTAASDTNYQCVTNDGTSTGTVTDSGVAFGTTPAKIRIDGDGGTNVFFYINGSLVCTHTTNLPDSYMGPQISVETLTAAAKKVRHYGLMAGARLP